MTGLESFGVTFSAGIHSLKMGSRSDSTSQTFEDSLGIVGE